jgi:hypothetical protein
LRKQTADAAASQRAYRMMTHLLLLALPALLFGAELLFIQLGYRYRRLPHDADSNAAVAPAVGTVLTLIGLVLAFSFSNAAGRLDANGKSILDEANAIETGWLRIDLAEPEARPRLAEAFGAYVDARIRAYETYEERVDLAEYDREVELSSRLFVELWSLAVAGTSPSVNRALLLEALSTVRDTATTRTLAMNTHLPTAIYLFLFGIVLIGALLIGGVLAQASGPLWYYRIIVAAVLSWTVFAIMDMEYPRLGAFQLLRNADALLVELRKSMH